MKRALTLLALLAACKSPSSSTAPPVETVSCTDVTPCVLTSGKAQQGAIAAVAQIDVYTVSAPANGKRTLLKVALGNQTPVSPVRLSLSLGSGDGASVLATRYWPQRATGVELLGGVFLLPSSGTYRLVVRDSENTHADARNGYALTATLLDDPDPAEPDDAPPQARPLVLSAQLNQTMGVVASAGDLDLCKFTVPAPGALVRWVVSQPASSGLLRLRARLLRRSAIAADSLRAASAVAEVDASGAGAAVAVDVVRSLPAGDYLIALDDLSGQEGDPGSLWTAGVQTVPNPDPNEQSAPNDTPQTATQLAPTGTTRGAIGSQGDVDWYEVQLRETTTAQILELQLDPVSVTQDVELTWAVGDVLRVPQDPCAQTDLPSAFEEDGGPQRVICGYLEHANHHFLRGETQVQLVRVRHLGAAGTVRVLVRDFGDQRWSNRLYTLSARLIADPDANEATLFNDTRDAGTPLAYRKDADAGLHFSTEGQIASWDAIDGLTTAGTPEDLDWYHLPLPPRTLAPACSPPDAGLIDAGLCTPDRYDGGPVYLPRPDYGVAVHWHNPADGAYQLGLQGTLTLDAGTACFFSIDQSLGHLEDDGGYALGNRPTDPCFCVLGREADQLWIRLEAAHRAIAPAPNRYSDLPYSFEMDLSPGEFQLACDGGCPGATQASCDGNRGY